MDINGAEIGTDEWLLKGLVESLTAGWERLEKLGTYREGLPSVVALAQEEVKQAYERVANRSRLNVQELAVSTKTSRLEVLGFRTGSSSSVSGDDEAWRIWKNSNMPLQSRNSFTGTGHLGETFILVEWPQELTEDGLLVDSSGDEMTPIFHVLNGWTCAVRFSALRPGKVEYAIVASYDDFHQREWVTLYGIGWSRRAYRDGERTRPEEGVVSGWTLNDEWEWLEERQVSKAPTKCQVFSHHTESFQGIYEPHLDTVDRINDGILQRVTIALMQAFRQRAVKTGELDAVYPEDHPNAGEEIDYNSIFATGPAAMWLLPGDADIWESSPTDIGPLTEAEKHDIQHFAAVTSTPLYALQPDALEGSAAGAAVARETLVFAVRTLATYAEDAFASAMACAFEMMGDEARSDPASIELIWRPVTQFSLAEAADAALKAKQSGKSDRFVNERIWGMTPQEIKLEEEAVTRAGLFNTGAQVEGAGQQGAQSVGNFQEVPKQIQKPFSQQSALPGGVA